MARVMCGPSTASALVRLPGSPPPGVGSLWMEGGGAVSGALLAAGVNRTVFIRADPAWCLTCTDLHLKGVWKQDPFGANQHHQRVNGLKKQQQPGITFMELPFNYPITTYSLCENTLLNIHKGPKRGGVLG